MTQSQTNTLNMFRTVTTLMEKKQAEWNSLAPIVEVMASVKNILTQVDGVIKNQLEHNTTGYTQQKEIKMDEMVALAYKLASKVRAYAKRSGNTVLLAVVDHSPSALASGTDLEVIKRCQAIASKATESLEALAPYKVTQTEIDALHAVITEVEPIGSRRDAVLSERKTATATIPELLRDGREQLELLDDMVDGMIDNAELVESYFNARRINDRSASGATPPKESEKKVTA